MPGVRYHDVVDEWADGTIEVFVPVAAPFEPPDGIEVKTMPGGAVAFTIHRGPYDEIGPVYHELMAWIQEHGHEIAGPPSELYMNDPREVGMDEALTEIRVPIR
jgi:effector-binding domain-containing protein